MREGAITEEELAAIKQRAERATPGPWFVAEELAGRADITTDPSGQWPGFRSPHVCVTDGPEGDRACRVNDAEFIAAAREDVPALVAEIERLRALLLEVANYEDDLTTGPWPRVWAEFGVYAPEQQQ
jgi:hypothetical protein